MHNGIVGQIGRLRDDAIIMKATPWGLSLKTDFTTWRQGEGVLSYKKLLESPGTNTGQGRLIQISINDFPLGITDIVETCAILMLSYRCPGKPEWLLLYFFASPNSSHLQGTTTSRISLCY